MLCLAFSRLHSSQPHSPRSRSNRCPTTTPASSSISASGLWAWPLPMDFDGDGDLDLVVNCPDKPSNGVYFFENVSGDTAKNKMPVFKPGRRISKGLQNVQVSYVDGKPRVLTPGAASIPIFSRPGSNNRQKLPLPANIHPQQGPREHVALRGLRRRWHARPHRRRRTTGPNTAGTTPTTRTADG